MSERPTQPNLTSAERRAFDAIAEDLRCEGVLAPEAQTGATLAGFELVEDESAIPQVPTAGFGVVDVTAARKALDEARKGTDVQRTLDAHHAWLDLVDELPAAVKRAQDGTRRAMLTVFVLTLIAGLALGFGLAALLFGLVGR